MGPYGDRCSPTRAPHTSTTNRTATSTATSDATNPYPQPQPQPTLHHLLLRHPLCHGLQHHGQRLLTHRHGAQGVTAPLPTKCTAVMEQGHRDARKGLEAVKGPKRGQELLQASGVQVSRNGAPGRTYWGRGPLVTRGRGRGAEGAGGTGGWPSQTPPAHQTRTTSC